MNPNNEIIKTPEPNLPIPIGQNLPVPAEPKAVVPVKLDMSPEEMGKALQLRHETRLTVKEPDLPPIDLSFLDKGETYKEPIRLNFGDEIEPGKRRMHSGASGRLIGRAVGAVVATAVMAAHQKVHEVENENSAVKGAHRAEIISEHSVRSAARSYNRYRARQRNQLRDEPTREKPKKSNSHQGDHSAIPEMESQKAISVKTAVNSKGQKSKRITRLRHVRNQKAHYLRETKVQKRLVRQIKSKRLSVRFLRTTRDCFTR